MTKESLDSIELRIAQRKQKLEDWFVKHGHISLLLEQRPKTVAAIGGARTKALLMLGGFGGYDYGTMPDGHFTNNECSNDAYHSDPAVGSSALRRMDCPATFYAAELDPRFSEDFEINKDVSEIGSMAHCMVLEPSALKHRYIKGPAGVTSKAVKAWKEFAKPVEEAGLVPVKEKDYNRIEAMAERLWGTPDVVNMLKAGEPENSFFCTCPHTGLRLKARPDFVTPGDIMVDYKTTGISLDNEKWSSHVLGLNTDLQVAHHKTVVELTTGKPIKHVVHIVQSTVAPFNVRIFVWPDYIISNAKTRMGNALETLADCIADDNWPQPPLYGEIVPPYWYRQLYGDY